MTRKIFRNSELAKYVEHFKWLTTALKNTNCCLLVCELKEGKPIAIVRFDLEGRSFDKNQNL